MAVIGTYCQICGLPVQHTHYVPTGDPNFLEIYSNAADSSQVEPVLKFGPQNEWLRAGVTLPLSKDPSQPPHHGNFSEGTLELGKEVYFVGNGLSDLAALHEACWSLAGKPSELDPIRHLRYSHAWATISRYHEQLFDFQSFVDDQKAWMLEDPVSSAKSKKRIQDIIESGVKNLPLRDSLPFKTVDQALASHFWRHSPTGEAPLCGFWRYRLGIDPKMNKGAFGGFVQSDHEFSAGKTGLPTGKDLTGLEEYEHKLITELEKSGKAILLLSLVNRGEMHFVLYAKDMDSCEAELTKLSQQTTGTEAHVGSEQDPEWKIYFEEFFPSMDASPL